MMIITKRMGKRELCGLKAGYISGQSGLIITTQPDGVHHNTVTGENVCIRGFSFKRSKSNLASPRKNPATTVDTHLTHDVDCGTIHPQANSLQYVLDPTSCSFVAQNEGAIPRSALCGKQVQNLL